VNENAVVLILALPSSMGADGSNARSPELKLLTTVTMFNPVGIGQYAPGSSSCADAHRGISRRARVATAQGKALMFSMIVYRRALTHGFVSVRMRCAVAMPACVRRPLSADVLGQEGLDAGPETLWPPNSAHTAPVIPEHSEMTEALSIDDNSRAE
jgi:hypothetical protein